MVYVSVTAQQHLLHLRSYERSQVHTSVENFLVIYDTSSRILSEKNVMRGADGVGRKSSFNA